MSRSLKVGIFIVGGVALFCVGIFLIGSQTQFFGSHFTAYAEFNNVNTLSSGSAVRVGGMSAGQIAGISVPIIIGMMVQASGGSYFGALMFMAGAGVVMFIAAMTIDYSKKIPV